MILKSSAALSESPYSGGRVPLTRTLPCSSKRCTWEARKKVGRERYCYSCTMVRELNFYNFHSRNITDQFTSHFISTSLRCNLTCESPL